jgi:hypothetical protein
MAAQLAASQEGLSSMELINATLKWVDDFNVRGSVVNRFVGPTRSVSTPENGEQLTVVVQ